MKNKTRNSRQNVTRIIAIAMAVLMFAGTFSSCLFIFTGMSQNKEYTFSDITNLSSSPEDLAGYFSDDEEALTADNINDVLNWKYVKCTPNTDELDDGTEIIIYDEQHKNNPVAMTFYLSNICKIADTYYKIIDE